MRALWPSKQLLRVLDTHAHFRERTMRAGAPPRVRQLPSWRERHAEWEEDHRNPRAGLPVVFRNVSSLLLPSVPGAPQIVRIGLQVWLSRKGDHADLMIVLTSIFATYLMNTIIFLTRPVRTTLASHAAPPRCHASRPAVT